MIRIEPSDTASSARFPIAEALGVGVAAIDDSGCQTYINPVFAEMVGWTPAELVGEGAPYKYWPEEELETIADAFARTVAGTAPAGGFELRFMRKSGERFPVLVTVSRMNVEGTTGWAAAVVDITEQKRVEEALHDREQRLDLAMRAGRLGSWEYQLDTGRVIWSTTLEQIHGLEPGTFGGTFEDYKSDIHPEDLESVLATIANSTQGKAAHRLQYRIILPTGEIRWLEASGQLHNNIHGVPTRMLGVCSDITERKMAEQQARLAREEAERANRSKSEFLAAMSHELRTPLNAIGGYLDLLDLEIHGPVTPQQRKSFRSIKRNQDHLLVVINDLLNFAKVEAGRIEFRIVDIPTAAFVEDMAALLEPHAVARGIDFVLEPIASNAVMRADRERLQQILLNLVSNAVKFTASGGSVRVHCAEDDASILINVTDTGRGIEAAKIESIFEPFVQIDRMSVSNSEKGVGLGLSISRDLARGMGGNLTVVSTPGSGSTFTVALPRVRGTAEDLV